MKTASGTMVRTGAWVMTADGKQVGTVKDAHIDRFLVDARWSPDFWLGSETIDNASDGLVQLFITKRALGAAKLHEYEMVNGPGLGNDR